MSGEAIEIFKWDIRILESILACRTVYKGKFINEFILWRVKVRCCSYLVGLKSSNTKYEMRAEMMMDREVAKPLRMLSAYLMTMATTKPPRACRQTTVQQTEHKIRLKNMSVSEQPVARPRCRWLRYIPETSLTLWLLGHRTWSFQQSQTQSQRDLQETGRGWTHGQHARWTIRGRYTQLPLGVTVHQVKPESLIFLLRITRQKNSVIWCEYFQVELRTSLSYTSLIITPAAFLYT